MLAKYEKQSVVISMILIYLVSGKLNEEDLCIFLDI